MKDWTKQELIKQLMGELKQAQKESNENLIKRIEAFLDDVINDETD